MARAEEARLEASCAPAVELVKLTVGFGDLLCQLLVAAGKPP